MAASWRQFETEVANLLRAAGFTVTPNAKAAKPRQTDIFAKSDKVDLLIEVKNRKSKIDLGDIAALRDRLDRIAYDIVGVVFSTSGLTEGAIGAIESDRRREVLVFVKEEIEQLRRGNLNVINLIDRKREELRAHGKAWFGSAPSLEFVGTKLPPTSIEFRIRGKIAPYFESKSRFAGASYALDIPDSGWANFKTEGARLSLDLNLNTMKDLRNIFGYLHVNFGLSKYGAFSIQQSECCWYGIGAEKFLRVVEAWRIRYSQSKSKNFHHAESLSYFDQFRDGWIEVSAQQHFHHHGTPINQASFLIHSELVVQLPGVPIDASPFLKLCNYVGVSWANFQFIGERWTMSRRLKKPIRLKTIGTIEDRHVGPSDKRQNDATIIGIIARNPFFLVEQLPEELLGFDISIRQELKETETFPCALRHWHGAGQVTDYYKLTGIEATIGGASNIIRPFGSWNRILEQ